MKKEIGDYLVKIELFNNFTEREITKARLSQIENWIKNYTYSGTFDVWSDDDFPENIEETTSWDINDYGNVFRWSVIDYKKSLYPTEKPTEKWIKLCYQYKFSYSDYESSTEKYLNKDKPQFSREYKLIAIGYCSKNLINN